MRSCLLWLSLLLVVLADRSLASPYFDEGESSHGPISVFFVFVFCPPRPFARLDRARYLRRTRGKEDSEDKRTRDVREYVVQEIEDVSRTSFTTIFFFSAHHRSRRLALFARVGV